MMPVILTPLEAARALAHHLAYASGDLDGVETEGTGESLDFEATAALLAEAVRREQVPCASHVITEATAVLLAEALRGKGLHVRTGGRGVGRRALSFKCGRSFF
jgi:hypothetical protein